MNAPNEPTTTDQRVSLRSWFTARPRAHGEVLEDRTVSFLELFYDLVFVVLIAQIAHTLAGHVTWSGVRDFAIVFTLIWTVWLNGSYYHELHGREDGRNRSYIFSQMILLVLLSVYAAHAADDASDGRAFAIVYCILLGLIAAQWFALRKYDDETNAAITLQYVAMMGVVITIVAVSAVVGDQDVRLGLWVLAILVTIAGVIVSVFNVDEAIEANMRVTESMAERFGLLTIIVLGEVVVGVADGLAEADRSIGTITTGVISLTIGFGFWWNYFDLVGKRQPVPGSRKRTVWNFFHLPMWLGIAGAGAGMVSLIEHAGDSRTPEGTAWLVTGFTALTVLSLAAITTTMPPHPGRKLAPAALVATAVVAGAIGLVRPAPIVLVLVLTAMLSAVWFDMFVRHARAGQPIGTD